MSFSKTISVVAALASIFGAGAAGWKLAHENEAKPVEEVNVQYQEHITELQKQIADLQKQATTVNPPTAVPLPQPTIVKQVTPQPVTLPSAPQPTPPPPPPVISSVNDPH